MNIDSILKDCAIDVAAVLSAAAQTAVTTDVFDMQGWDGIIFLAYMGDVTSGSVLTLTAYSNTTNAASGGTAEGNTTAATAGTSDYDDKLIVLEILRPTSRYMYATLTRTAQNAAVNGILALRFRGSAAPVTQGSDVAASAQAVC